LIRERIHVRGIVQGVGFRPFIYRTAVSLGLKGWVFNDSSGVEVEVEGEEKDVESFKKTLESHPPPLATISSLESLRISTVGSTDFLIRDSHKNAPTATLISPDIALCGDCLREMEDPADRRYGYPFINCTNCGPRYTIIEDIPYDRPKTSMKHFTMCRLCAGEYHDPEDRRFHAQPNACWECGPRLNFVDGDGRPSPENPDPLEETVGRLEKGEIAAIKGLGGFHLAVEATSGEAVKRLRLRKNREEKPLAVMVASLETARLMVHLSPEEELELDSPRKPIVLARKKENAPVAREVSPDNDYLGIMLPYTPLHRLLFSSGDFTALVMTSANLSEEPICIGNDEALTRLEGIADCFLLHDRLIHFRTDDSVIRIFRGRSYPIRRSRGYAPAPVPLTRSLRPVIGLGGELKNTVCLVKRDQAFLSQHVGDMENEETDSFFRKTVHHLEKILECRAEILAYDLHPGYLTTRYALEQEERPTWGVQHHHAHAVSCLAEHGLDGPALAVTFDGTGFGEEGRIWGGEILLADRSGYRREAHLLEVPMPGGDSAVREPFRMALSYLYSLYGLELFDRVPEFARRHPREKTDIILSMIDKGINTFMTSSAGRLFDAVSSLLNIRDRVSFEGQAAMELEYLAGDGELGHYPFDMDSSGEPVVINTLPVVEAVVSELAAGADPQLISTRFHQTLAVIIREVLINLKRRSGIGLVVLSGGVFQNSNLLERTVRILQKEKFEVYWHEKVPTNDGGLSLGQAVVAHEKSLSGG
jgi:hydrogenase maturation protein HypF